MYPYDTVKPSAEKPIHKALIHPSSSTNDASVLQTPSSGYNVLHRSNSFNSSVSSLKSNATPTSLMTTSVASSNRKHHAKLRPGDSEKSGPPVGHSARFLPPSRVRERTTFQSSI